MESSLSSLTFHNCFTPHKLLFFLAPHVAKFQPLTISWRRLGSCQDLSLVSSRTKGQSFQILANPNRSSGMGGLKDEVIMVDPVEAKRLAAKQMKEIQANERFKRKRQVEAFNGAWAIIGLTAGLVIEGHTGKSILAQLAGYWSALIGIFVK